MLNRMARTLRNAGGLVFHMLDQPLITGFLVAGSIIGPGGLNLVHELVQVETLADFGVFLLLFGLGLVCSISPDPHLVTNFGS